MNHKIYAMWSGIAGFFLMTAAACNIDWTGLFSAPEYILRLLLYVGIGGILIIAILLIFFTSGNKKD